MYFISTKFEFLSLKSFQFKTFDSILYRNPNEKCVVKTKQWRRRKKFQWKLPHSIEFFYSSFVHDYFMLNFMITYNSKFKWWTFFYLTILKFHFQTAVWEIHQVSPSIYIYEISTIIQVYVEKFFRLFLLFLCCYFMISLCFCVKHPYCAVALMYFENGLTNLEYPCAHAMILITVVLTN